jgi:acyl-CoA reductase-like NAD-dependent aldehyde dehydrogenase
MDALVTPPSLPPPSLQAVVAALDRARAAGAAWAAVPLPERLAVIGRARRLLAARGEALAALVPQRAAADTLVAEVLPLAEAARWLARTAPRLLAPRCPPGGRPLWLAGVRAEVWREPLGAVLILAPGNYPLFLPGVQALQALAAGNAVCAKPAPGRAAVLHAFTALLVEAGLPADALQVLDEGVETGRAAAAAGFDLVVLTGSAATGEQVLAACARTLTPAVAELSGCDAVFVLPGADLALVADCLAYGLRLNGGATCIAPRRVFVPRAQAAALEGLLAERLPGIPPAAVAPAIAARLDTLVADALAAGARRVAPAAPGAPAVLASAAPEMALLGEDVFAPWLAIVPVLGTEEALAAASRCPYALGVSIFGPDREARALAARVRAGSVCVNDLIVPTADPRLPFAGRGRSGFGATRGAEGLLAMTQPKAVSVRRSRFRPHLAPPRADDAARFAALLALLHGDWSARAGALRRLGRKA